MTTAAIAAFPLSIQPAAHANDLLSRGHTDIGIAFEDGVFDLHIHSEKYGVEFAPDEAVLRVLPQAGTIRPANAAYDFIGAPAGAALWVLPQDEASAENLGLLLLGVGAEEISPEDFQGNLSARLVSYSFTPEPGGPSTAHVSFYTQSGIGQPTPVWTTSDGLSATDVATVIPGTHFDGNWAFTAPGHYSLTIEVSGTTAGGAAVSAQGTYQFVVKSFASPVSTQIASGEIIDAGGEWARVKRPGPVSAAPNSGGVSVISITPLALPSTITSANDTILAALKNYDLRIVAREGKALPELPEAKLKSFTDASQAHDGNAAFIATLASGIGGVSSANNTVVLGELPGLEAPTLGIALRKGDSIAGHPDFIWSRAIAVIPADDRSIAMIAQGVKPATRTGKTFVVRATPKGGTIGFDLEILAATGSSLVTDRGVRVVRSFARPTRAGQRPADNHGGIEILVYFTDGTSEIVRFGTAPISLD